MANFAVIENNKVINIVIAESKTIAEEITNKTCVEYTESNPAFIGSIYNGTNFETTPVLEETK